MPLRQGMPAWTVLDEEVQQGMIHRVNREDEHGQVTYDAVAAILCDFSNKAGIIRVLCLHYYCTLLRYIICIWIYIYDVCVVVHCCESYMWTEKLIYTLIACAYRWYLVMPTTAMVTGIADVATRWPKELYFSLSKIGAWCRFQNKTRGGCCKQNLQQREIHISCNSVVTFNNCIDSSWMFMIIHDSLW